MNNDVKIENLIRHEKSNHEYVQENNEVLDLLKSAIRILRTSSRRSRHKSIAITELENGISRMYSDTRMLLKGPNKDFEEGLD